jgi:ATP-dependent Lon protease
LVLIIIVTQPFSPTALQTVKKNNTAKPIQARLYFPPVKKQPIVTINKVSPIIEESIAIDEKVNNSRTLEKKTPKTAQKKVTKTQKESILSAPSNQQINKKILTSNSSTKSIAQTSLENLQGRLNDQLLEYSQKEGFNKYLADKNTIDPSVTKFNQLPVAKAKIKEVDCNASNVNIAVTAISGLFGGSVRCNSMPNLKGFLDKRTKEKGK